MVGIGRHGEVWHNHARDPSRPPGQPYWKPVEPEFRGAGKSSAEGIDRTDASGRASLQFTSSVPPIEVLATAPGCLRTAGAI
jgi:hypothetical protein